MSRVGFVEYRRGSEFLNEKWRTAHANTDNVYDDIACCFLILSLNEFRYYKRRTHEVSLWKNLQSRHCATVTDKYRDRDIVEKPKAINLMQRWMVLKFKFSEQYILCNDAYFDL